MLDNDCRNTLDSHIVGQINLNYMYIVNRTIHSTSTKKQQNNTILPQQHTKLFNKNFKQKYIYIYIYILKVNKKSVSISLSEQNKSALINHASHDNHVINWSESTILDRKSDRGTRWIREAGIFKRRDGGP